MTTVEEKSDVAKFILSKHWKVSGHNNGHVSISIFYAPDTS